MTSVIYITALISLIASTLSGFSGDFGAVSQNRFTESNTFNSDSIGMIDGHADTITAALEIGQGLNKNDLHIDFERLKKYGAPVQIFTVWLDDKYVKDAFEYTNSAIDFFEEELKKNSETIALALSNEDIIRNVNENKISAILALEGGEPLVGKIENVDHFYNRGVRLITLTWNRENELGYGASAESNKGLKPFGKQCVKRMNELNMIIDVSHLNEAGFWDVHNLSSMPYMASHSNAYSVASHRRNLKDAQIKAIIERGGVIGINLYPYFLTNSENADIEDVMKHIEYFLSLGAEDNIGLGADFDGVDILPEGITDVSSIASLEQKIRNAYGEELSSAIMYGNFYDFLRRTLE